MKGLKIYMQKYIIGIDIGGTKCAVILGTAKGEGQKEVITIQSRSSFATKDFDGPAQVISKLSELIWEQLQNYRLSANQISGIGISCGGPLDHVRGIIQSPPNLYGWDNIPIVKMLEEEFSIPTYLQNDANACALAEWKMGAAKGCQNAIFLTFGTGLGAGLILNGQLYNGANDMAGEIGHIRLTQNGPVGYGKAGSFEGYCSGSGIAQIARTKVLEKLQMGEKPMLCKSPEQLDLLTAKSVADAARKKDPLALDIYATSGSYLGRGLAILIDILNPEIIVIGSIYERCEDLLSETMYQMLQKEALEISRKGCLIVPARLGDKIGDYASLCVGLHGAGR